MERRDSHGRDMTETEYRAVCKELDDLVRGTSMRPSRPDLERLKSLRRKMREYQDAREKE